MGKHLTEEQRYRIYALQGQGLTQAAIAAEVGNNQSVISREMKRNRGQRGYRPKQAQALSQERRRVAYAVPHVMRPKTIGLIEDKLRREQLSPEQIRVRSHFGIYRGRPFIQSSDAAIATPAA